MQDLDAVFEAAQALGEALKESEEAQALQRVEQALRDDPEVRELEAEVARLQSMIAGRQQAGEPLASHEINRFYHLRDRLAHHPLVVERRERQKALRALCERAGSAIGSIITVDYAALVLGEG